MHLTIALPLRNQPALMSFLSDLYNPASPSFHQFLTVEQFTAAYGPTQEDYNALIGFAQTHGLTVFATSPNRVNLQVTGTAAQVEAAFHVTLNQYRDPDVPGRTFYAPNVEPMPDLSIPLWHVSGLDSYAIPHHALSQRPAGTVMEPNATTGSCPSASFCGSDMRAAYYGTGSLTGAGESVGLFEFLGTNLSDLTKYYTNAHQTLTVPVTVKSVDGAPTTCTASAGCSSDAEQTLDMTQALGMAPGLSSLVMYVGKSSPSLDDAGILNAMATASPLDHQIGCSWMWRPADSATDDPYFLEFQAQGQNFFVAAGDSGKWPTPASAFYWPAESPNTVAVGGTSLKTASAGGAWASETAWAHGGGGISPDHFAIPTWQVTTAAGCTSCSQTYRNAPDVSANSDYTFYVCADGSCTANNYGGTSFAAPMWAGYLALANQQAMANSGSPIGFLNPTFYPIGLGSTYNANFHDITAGSNGYSATVGFDLATGWGSPNGPTLINTLAPPASGDFTIGVKPATVPIARGAAGHARVTTTVSGSFNSAVALTATGMGSGVKVTFNPASIAAPGAGTSTITIKVGANATTGTRTITVTGTGGGKTHTATFKITIS